jgi:hypothetical protein
MTSIDLTVLRPLLLMPFRMAQETPPLPADAIERFSVGELAQILALSRFSRRPVKLILHSKGLPNHSQAFESFIAAVPSHPQFGRISELADLIAGALRYHASPSTPNQST